VLKRDSTERSSDQSDSEGNQAPKKIRSEERQREAKTIAGEVDTMLVIGGRHSSNTQKLFEICKKECGNTYYIQTPVDLDSEMFQCSSYVGITAGASTPKKIIEEVQEHVRIEF
jgi:4-hydroxy-3-methylbut-2-enyl diphosphate reductase